MKLNVSKLGFCSGLLLFLLANYYNYKDNQKSLARCDDCSLSFGVPFEMYRMDGFAGISHYFWTELVANLFAGLVFSMGLGTLFQKVWQWIVHRSTKPE